MPGRKIPIITGNYYHIVNHGISQQNIFLDNRDYQRALTCLFYYQNNSLPLKYSRFTTVSIERQKDIIYQLRLEADFLADLVAYCLMPNHFHLILRQNCDKGIATYISNFENSYTRYFNTRHKRNGHLVKGKYSAGLIKNEGQLSHIVRYAHLNPYSAGLITTFESLENYPYSSLPEYLGFNQNNYCQKEIILSQYKSVEQYRQFTLDQADYQRSLQITKHQLLDY